MRWQRESSVARMGRKSSLKWATTYIFLPSRFECVRLSFFFSFFHPPPQPFGSRKPPAVLMNGRIAKTALVYPNDKKAPAHRWARLLFDTLNFDTDECEIFRGFDLILYVAHGPIRGVVTESYASRR